MGYVMQGQGQLADNGTKDWHGKHGRKRSFTHSKSDEAKRHDNHALKEQQHVTFSEVCYSGKMIFL
jgi:hypothetical protein